MRHRLSVHRGKKVRKNVLEYRQSRMKTPVRLYEAFVGPR